MSTGTDIEQLCPTFEEYHLLNRILALVGNGGEVVVAPGVTFKIDQDLVMRIAEPLVQGCTVNAHGERSDGATIEFRLYGLRHFFRLLKPPSKKVQVRHLRRWHTGAMRLAQSRGVRYAVKDEPVFCKHGHPIGLVRHHILHQEMIPERCVMWRLPMPNKRVQKWVDAKPTQCSWCGTADIRPEALNLNQPAWYMVDGVR